MINSAVQRLNTGVFKLNNNKKSIVALTTEKLSGFGVLSYKDTTSALPEAAGLGLCFYVKKN